MKKSLDKKLCTKYPILFQDRNKKPSKTAMCWGFQCGDGWYKLIDDLCEKLYHLHMMYGMDIVAFEVKEKGAALRFYYSVIPDSINGYHSPSDLVTGMSVISDVVKMAEYRSNFICEKCGKNRNVPKRDACYTYALCDTCWTKFKK